MKITGCAQFSISLIAALSISGSTYASQITINGPSGSGEFGKTVSVLPNGNFVVTDPSFDGPVSALNIGAVYLYRADGTLISTLTGSAANDRVGNAGITVLSNGNFVVRSPAWRNGSTFGAGAVTLVNGNTGISGNVSPSNSLVGTTSEDQIGVTGITTLGNGNFLIVSGLWDNGVSTDAGAVTFVNGVTGLFGAVSQHNSLVGSATNDSIGSDGITVLTNNNYVVRSRNWNNGAVTDAGAVTFGNGNTGVVGFVTPSNSLVGNTAGENAGSSVNEQFGSYGVTALTNGNYVVRVPNWDNGNLTNVGAVTFGLGTIGVTGIVTTANSLVGSSANDQVGGSGITVLNNGNYLVRSAKWDNGPVVDAGAVTFGNGLTGASGVVSSSNSLVGSSANDLVGSAFIQPLQNGNFVVPSPSWDNGAVLDVGAATFGYANSGITGPISSSNSLVGSSANDQVGINPVNALTNGNYLVNSPKWDNGAVIDVGAVTFGDGKAGVVGVVSPSNSLIGGTAGDQVGNLYSAPLNNGNFVVVSTKWDNGAVIDAGAATFGNGNTGIVGFVSAANSLVGTTNYDSVGNFGVATLGNGNYVINSVHWDNGSFRDAGAVTFGDGITGVFGAVSPSNSLVGSNSNDYVGLNGIHPIGNDNYLVVSTNWDNGSVVNAGAATFGNGNVGTVGGITPSNSLVGSTDYDAVGIGVGVGGIMLPSNGNFVLSSQSWNNGLVPASGAVTLGLSDGSFIGEINTTHSVLGVVGNGGSSQSFDYDPARNQLVVGQPVSNRVVLHRTGTSTTIDITNDLPDALLIGKSITISAVVSASPSSPTDGFVTFRASSGEYCVDNAPKPVGSETAFFSCDITFNTLGAVDLFAEYTGSTIHAFNRSPAKTHVVVAETVFENGFEL